MKLRTVGSLTREKLEIIQGNKCLTTVNSLDFITFGVLTLYKLIRLRVLLYKKYD